MLEAKHLRLLHVARRKMGIDEDDFRQLVAHYGKDCPGMPLGQPSTKFLTLPAFNKLMQHFERMGFVSSAKKAAQKSERRPGAATLRQIAMVEGLWRRYTNRHGDGLSLGKWLERTYGVSSARFLSFDMARKAIAALNAMVARADFKRSSTENTSF